MGGVDASVWEAQRKAIRRPDDFSNDAEFARETVWYGRKSGGFMKPRAEA